MSTSSDEFTVTLPSVYHSDLVSSSELDFSLRLLTEKSFLASENILPILESFPYHALMLTDVLSLSGAVQSS